MRKMMMLAALAALMATMMPARADDSDEDFVPERTEAVIEVEGATLNLVAKRYFGSGHLHFTLTHTGNGMIGTGNTFAEARQSLYHNYRASGEIEGTMPEAVLNDYRADGIVSEVISDTGKDLERVVRVKVDIFPTLTFVVHEWVTRYEGELFHVGFPVTFSIMPTRVPDEMLVVSTAPYTD